jgi:hypothetical protein
MKTSKHASERLQQRGIPKDYIDMILKHGTSIRKPGHALEYRLYKKDKDRIVKHYKHLIHLLDKCTTKAVVVDSDMEEIVTVYNVM